MTVVGSVTKSLFGLLMKPFNQGSYLLLSLSVLLGLCLTCGSAAGARYAITVGHNIGHAGEEPLRFAERDARRFRDVLVELGGVKKPDALLLLGPSKARVKAALSRIERALAKARQKGRQATVIFYFAGHGDMTHLHLGREKLERRALLERFRRLKADLKLVILDACQTSWVGRARGVRSGPSFAINVLQPARHKGVVVIHSTRKGEPAHESDALGGAVFTHYLVSALRGAADVDLDGRVTLLEAYTYAFRHTVRQSARGSSVVQHPSFKMKLKGSGALILTEPNKSRASLILPSGKGVRYLIFQQRSGAVVAEAMGMGKRRLRLAVPSGRLLIQRRLRRRFQVAQVNLPYGGQRCLSSRDFIDKPYDKVMRRGGRLLLTPNNWGIRYSLHAIYLPGSWVLWQGPSLHYARQMPGAWWLGVELGFRWSAYEEGQFKASEKVVDLQLLAGKTIELGVTTLALSAGPSLHLVFQNRRRRDADRLISAGMPVAEFNNTTLGAGGALLANWRIPLGGRWSVRIHFKFALMALKVAEASETKWQALPSLGGGVGFGCLF